MDYEKKYKEALEKAQRFYNNSVAITNKGLEDIFPELKESEDERIRKAIYNCVKWFGFDSCFFKDVSQEECLAWLEKQGEQNPADTENGTNGSEREFPIPEPPLTIKHAKEVMGIKQDDARSEEDDRMYNIIVSYIPQHLTAESYTACINWLKSFKDRVQPQPKQEWSEEDEQTFIKSVEALEDFGKFELADWLKEHKNQFLKPQNTWKPSELQIAYLSKVIFTLGNEGDCATAAELRELRDNLEMLKEK